MSVAIVDRAGVVMARGYGRASLDPERPVDADTLFRVASVSKTPTWIGIMQLVQDGKLTLQDPINDHLPPALRIPDDGFAEPIRVRHLLTHSAGFEDSAVGHLFWDRPERVISSESYLQRYRVRRVRPPGQVGVYSNYGATLAGAIIAHERGMQYVDYVESRILRPLGMRTATYREPYSPELAQARGLPAPMPADLAGRVTRGFVWNAGAFEPRPFEYVTSSAAAGGMSASANDMAAYLSALLDPARMEATGVLRAQTLLTMREPLSFNVDDFGPERHGFLDEPSARPHLGLGHGGDTIYQHSELAVFPELGWGLFLSVNTPTGGALRQTLLADLLAEFYGVVPPRSRRADNALAESSRVAGGYLPLRRPYHRTEQALFRLRVSTYTAAQNGDLLLGSGSETRRFAPVGQGVFEQIDGPRRLLFREVGGRMRLYDPLSVSPAERLGPLATPTWLLVVVILGVLGSIAAILGACMDLWARKRNPASLVLAGLGLLWLIAGGLTIAALLPWAGADEGVAVYGYPGRLFPLATWLLLIASLLTPLGLAAHLWLSRPRAWNRWQWTQAAARCAVFAALIATLWSWGFLGFSGF